MGLTFVPWLSAWVLTQAVETPIYVWALGRTRPLGERVAIGLGASALTHPFVWFVFIELLMPQGYVLYVGVAEAFAVFVEAVYLYVFLRDIRRALGISLIANASSVLVGVVLRELVGWP